MKIPSLPIERTFIDSRVARRLFWIVATCAVLPVVAFALFSYIQVKTQLEADASSALRSAIKESGMAILERLIVADETLRLQLYAFSLGSEVTVPQANIPAVRTIRRLEPGDPRLGKLAVRHADRPDRDHGLLFADVSAGKPRLLLMRSADPADTNKGIWLAELATDFIFRPDSQHPNDRFWIADSKGQLLFWSPSDWHPTSQELMAGESNGRAEIAGEASLVATQRILPLNSRDRHAWVLSQSRPLEDIHRLLREFEAVFPWIVGITLCGAVLLVVSQVRRTLVPIDALTIGAQRIASGDFDTRVNIRTGDEFETLSESFNHMAEVIGDQIHVLSTVNAIGAALSAENDTNRVLELILQGVVKLTHARSGVLYLLSDEKKLEATLMFDGDDRGPTGELLVGGTPLHLVERCLERGVTLHGADRPGPSAEARMEWEAFEQRLGVPITDYLALPMKVEKGRAMGVLLIVRSGDGRFSDEDAVLARSLASQAAVSVRKNEMIENFRGLFEGVVQLTVNAIDEKSPYTGDHCRKVPILVESIADAACADRIGALKDFDMTEDARYELRIAALLHDCGKVVTPVHVMDKARKLETISDRIEVIEARFDVLRCDARLRALTRQMKAMGVGPPLGGDDSQLECELAEIDDDLEFIKICNVGQERMSDADCVRIHKIADHRRWKMGTDRVRYVLDADEVTNLTIRRGTLNEAEREIINQHVVLTMKMLEALPWPDEIRQVPAIAGAHHERIDGTGYPLGLDAAQLSVQARILGLADIFEALTAKTRPYKPGRTLTESLEILDRMRDEGHIDPGLYELFVREKLHLRYAIEHLAPEQIDPEHQADIERLTAPTLA